MPLKAHEREMVRFLVMHAVYGIVGGAVFGGLVLYLDVAHIGTLISHSDSEWLFLILLFTGLSVTFGSIGMGVAIMTIGNDKP